MPAHEYNSKQTCFSFQASGTLSTRIDALYSVIHSMK